jgi:hypothetical protein
MTKEPRVSDKERLDEVYSIVTNLRDLGHMTEPAYMKAMLVLAADWAVMGDFAEALMLVSKINHTYIHGELVDQLENDSIFARSVYRLAELLVESGYASTEPVDGELALMLSVAKPAQA